MTKEEKIQDPNFPKEKSRVDFIFDNILEQLMYPDTLKTAEEQKVRFIEDLKSGNNRHIEPAKKKKNIDYYTEYEEQITSNGRNLNHFNKFKLHLNCLVRKKKVSPSIAKIFLENLRRFKYIGNYNKLVRNNVNVSPVKLREQSDLFLTKLEEKLTHFDEEQIELKTLFVHFNSSKEKYYEERIYVSLNLEKGSDEFLERWFSLLNKHSLDKDLYFKVSTGLSKRFDNIIVYIDKSIKDSILRSFFNEVRNIPQSLFSQESLPAAVSIGKGLSYAGEPNNLNRLYRHLGMEDQVSYNELISSLIQLSFEAAFHRINLGEKKSDIKMENLRDHARVYFKQLLEVTGINSSTMCFNSHGGTLPNWLR